MFCVYLRDITSTAGLSLRLYNIFIIVLEKNDQITNLYN